MANHLAEAATFYARAGVHVLPCDPANKRPCGELVPQDLGPDRKRVKSSGGLKKASCNSATILDWWALRPDAMIGVRTGATSGFWVVDLDRPKQVKGAPIGTMSPNGVEAWEKLVAEHGGHAPTLETITPTDGRHIWFRCDPARPVTNSEGRLSGLGINVRGDGGYVIVPPSVRADGAAYVANRNFDPDGIAPAPEWLYELISTPRKPEEGRPHEPGNIGTVKGFHPADRNRQKLTSALSGIPSDDREIWLRIGAALNTLEPEWGAEAQEIWDTWSRTSTKFDHDDQDLTWQGFDPARPDGATVATIFFEAKQRGWTNGPSQSWSDTIGPNPTKSAQVLDMKDYTSNKSDQGPTGPTWFYTLLSPKNSEDDLALTFTALHHENLRHVAAWGKWLEWTGTNWERENTLKVFDQARKVCRAASMSESTTPGESKKIANAKTVAAVEHLSKADRSIAATKDQWDLDEDAFNPKVATDDYKS